jgi:3'(2'), 5'-bisphosphate nucleotidase
MPLNAENFMALMGAVRQAIELTRTVQHNSFHSLTKDSAFKEAETEPVTIADYGAQVIIARALQTYFPDDGVLSEESGEQFLELVNDNDKATILTLLAQFLDQAITVEQVVTWLNHGKGKQTERIWTLDPIDGTKGFIGKRHYSVGVGIIENGDAVGALMGCPGYGDGISGDDSEGALFVVHPELWDGVPQQFTLEGETSSAIRVSTRNADQYRIVQSFVKAHASKERMAKVRDLSGLGDALLHEMDSMEKYALVANGDADLYLRLPRKGSDHDNKVWDHTPGVALVRASGGMVTDIDGSPLVFSDPTGLMPNQGMIVSNNVDGGALHERIVASVADVLTNED